MCVSMLFDVNSFLISLFQLMFVCSRMNSIIFKVALHILLSYFELKASWISVQVIEIMFETFKKLYDY